MASGEMDEAVRLAREAVDVIAERPSLQNEAHAHEVLGALLAQAGDAAGSTAEAA